MGSCKKQYLFWMIPGCVWIFTLNSHLMITRQWWRVAYVVFLQEEVQRSSVEDWAASSGDVAGCSQGNRLVSCSVAPLSQIWENYQLPKGQLFLHSPAHRAVIGSHMFIYVRLFMLFYLYPQTPWREFWSTVTSELYLWLITWAGWKFCSIFSSFLWQTFKNVSRQQKKSWKCKTFICFFKSQNWKWHH